MDVRGREGVAASFQFVVRRRLDRKHDLPLGLRLVFDLEQGRCYVHQIANAGLIAQKNGRLQNWPEVASQRLQVGDILVAVNDKRDHAIMSQELHTAPSVHILVYRPPASQVLTFTTPASSVPCGAQPSPSSERSTSSRAAVTLPEGCAELVFAVPVQLEHVDAGGVFKVFIHYNCDAEPERGYLSLSRGDFVQVQAETRQGGDGVANLYHDYVFGMKAGGGEQGWFPAAILTTPAA